MSALRTLSLIIVDRTPREATFAAVATWVAFVLTLPRQVGPSVPANVIAALLAVPLVLVGYAATSRCRPLSEVAYPQRARRAGLALGAGAVLGVTILAVDFLLASVDPRVARIAGDITDSWWEPLLRAAEAAPFEEVLFRLVGMSVIAWAVARYTRYGAQAFPLALGSSAVLFGLAHLPYLSLVGLGLVAGNTAGGLVVGWLFWRWGLPYAIFCHFAAGVIIQGVGPSVLP